MISQLLLLSKISKLATCATDEIVSKKYVWNLSDVSLVVPMVFDHWSIRSA